MAGPHPFWLPFPADKPEAGSIQVLRQPYASGEAATLPRPPGVGLDWSKPVTETPFFSVYKQVCHFILIKGTYGEVSGGIWGFPHLKKNHKEGTFFYWPLGVAG